MKSDVHDFLNGLYSLVFSLGDGRRSGVIFDGDLHCTFLLEDISCCMVINENVFLEHDRDKGVRPWHWPANTWIKAKEEILALVASATGQWWVSTHTLPWVGSTHLPHCSNRVTFTHFTLAEPLLRQEETCNDTWCEKTQTDALRICYCELSHLLPLLLSPWKKNK